MLHLYSHCDGSSFRCIQGMIICEGWRIAAVVVGLFSGRSYRTAGGEFPPVGLSALCCSGLLVESVEWTVSGVAHTSARPPD